MLSRSVPPLLLLLVLGVSLSGQSTSDQSERAPASSVTSKYKGGVFRVGGGVKPPQLILDPDPEYSDEARKARLEGTVVLWMIVGTDGAAHDIRVKSPLGKGLDEKAIEAVKRWKFKPATKDGQPVAVMVNVEVSFRLTK